MGPELVATTRWMDQEVIHHEAGNGNGNSYHRREFGLFREAGNSVPGIYTSRKKWNGMTELDGLEQLGLEQLCLEHSDIPLAQRT